MDRNEVIERLEENTIVDGSNDESEPLGGLEISERLRASVASVKVKTRSDGRPIGDKESKRGRTTARQKAFASLIVQGHSPREAYAKAYNVKTDNASSHASTANKLLKNSKVSALVEACWHSTKESLVNDAIATRRHVMEQLLKHSEEAKQEGTKLKALELMGRAVGMFTDKVEQKIEEVSTDQLKAELKSSLALLDNVKPFKQAKSR
jgi:DNA-binding ferritin-like protein (Dps family)